MRVVGCFTSHCELQRTVCSQSETYAPVYAPVSCSSDWNTAPRFLHGGTNTAARPRSVMVCARTCLCVQLPMFTIACVHNAQYVTQACTHTLRLPSRIRQRRNRVHARLFLLTGTHDGAASVRQVYAVRLMHSAESRDRTIYVVRRACRTCSHTRPHRRIRRRRTRARACSSLGSRRSAPASDSRQYRVAKGHGSAR